MSHFQKKILALLAKIPRGRVVTYKLLAKAAGRPKAWRAVGRACANNPKIGIIPCHRVVKSSGEVGGYVKGAREKIRLLRKEGIEIKNGKIVGLKKYLVKSTTNLLH